MLLNVAITPEVLIDMAKQKSGLELQQMAQELGYSKTRITKLKKGACALSPTEVAYFTSKAGLPFMETMKELEIAKNPDAAQVWDSLRVTLIEQVIEGLDQADQVQAEAGAMLRAVLDAFPQEKSFRNKYI